MSMIADNDLANLEFLGIREVVTLAREGRNTEVSYCCGSLTSEYKKQVIDTHK